MYHERTPDQERAAKAKWIALAFACVLALGAGSMGLAEFQRNTAEQSAMSVRESVLNTAMQCFAIEGSYPSSLQHLKDVYGLTVNEDDYIIHYEWFADNIPPSVMVVPRDE